MELEKPMDKAGKNYWDNNWSNNDIPKVIDHREQSLDNYVNRRFHQYFSKLFTKMEAKNKSLLEIGCARSVWLPYFNREFGLTVSGIDYSEIGCHQARIILSNSGVNGNVICSDFFTPPDFLVNCFDVVISFGVVEHFENTQACLSAFAKFLQVNGIIITIIPNVVGSIGLLQKIFDRATYQVHVPLDKKALSTVHHLAGFNIIECKYFLPTNFGVINVENLDKALLRTRIIKYIQRNLSRTSKLINLIDERMINLPESSLFSPYIICVAQKK